MSKSSKHGKAPLEDAYDTDLLTSEEFMNEVFSVQRESSDTLKRDRAAYGRYVMTTDDNPEMSFDEWSSRE